MKRLLAIMMTLSLLLCAAPALAEDSLETAAEAVKSAATLDEQLAQLSDLSTTYAAELEAGSWFVSLSAHLAQPLPEAFAPPAGFDDAIRDGAPPEAVLGLKTIALYRKDDYDGHGSSDTLLGDFLARLPAANRAASMAEAQAVLLLREYFSYNENYTGTAYNRHYATYLWQVGGDRLWYIGGETTMPPHSGYGILEGSEVPLRNLWGEVRDNYFGITFEVKDEQGSVMTFETTGDGSCYLKDVALAAGVTALEVPGTAEGLAVTGIGEMCFHDNAQIESVALPEGLARISWYAFKGCENLMRVDLPETLQIVDESAFSGCPSLRELTLPDSVQEIGFNAFYDCRSLEAARVPASLLEADEPWRFVRRVARVAIGEGLERLPAFPDSTSLMCCYVPASLLDVSTLEDLDGRVTFYAPAGSDAMNALTRAGRTCVPCVGEADMPIPEYVVVGEFEFLVFEGEAALSRCLGEGDDVAVPDEAAGCPVTRLLCRSCDGRARVVVPASVAWIDRYVSTEPLRLYIANPVAALDEQVDTLAIHAPEGSTSQRFAGESGYAFEPWDGETPPF